MTAGSRTAIALFVSGGVIGLGLAIVARKKRPAPSPTCPIPMTGQRWLICAPSGGNIITVSQGDYDAFYDRVTGSYIASVDNRTYQEDGRHGSAVVVPRSSTPWVTDSYVEPGF